MTAFVDCRSNRLSASVNIEFTAGAAWLLRGRLVIGDMLVQTIMAPAAAPQIPAAQPPPPHQPRLDWLDEKIVETLRDSGVCPIWSLLNVISEEEAPNSRADARKLRIKLWQKIKHLRRFGLLYTVGRNSVSPTPLDAGMRRLFRKSRRPTVRRTASFCAVSAQNSSQIAKPPEPKQLILREADNAKQLASERTQKPEETKSALSAEQIAQAARSLAQRPRRVRRKWSGWIGRIHCWRDQQVILPTGESCFIFGVLRGQAVITFDRGRLLGGYFGDGGPQRWTVVAADQVTVYKCPEAQLLGRLKAGCREKPSVRKRFACIQNGRRPCAPGKHRGRP